MSKSFLLLHVPRKGVNYKVERRWKSVDDGTIQSAMMIVFRLILI